MGTRAQQQAKERRRTPLIVRIAAWLVAIAAVCAVALTAVWFQVTRPMTGTQDEYEVQLRIPDGMTVRGAAAQLEEQGLIRSATLFYLAARYRAYGDFTLRSGFYTLRSSLSMRDIFRELQSGSPEYVTVGLPEGLTMTKTARLLADAGVCKAESFLAACTSGVLLAEYGIPARTFEGFLFPDTYFFVVDSDAEAVLRTLVDTFFERAGTIAALSGKDRQALFETVILASIVEREYRVESEAPLIASVFANRLAQHQGLESCATVEYIITEQLGRPHPDRILYADLEIDSPYNTYQWAGLPPGPIANPGLVALRAAAEPAQTDYRYFVLTDAEAGTHTFSTTFDQHKAAQASMYLTKRAAGGS